MGLQHISTKITRSRTVRGGRVVRWCLVNFQCQGILLIWISVGQGPTALAVGAGLICLDIFSLVYHFSFLSPSLWEAARYGLKYHLKDRPQQPANRPAIRGTLQSVLHIKKFTELKAVIAQDRYTKNLYPSSTRDIVVSKITLTFYYQEK